MCLPKKNSSSPRPIIASFLKFKEKENVIKAGPKQKPQINGKSIYVNHDYSGTVMQKRRALLPLMEEKRSKGLRAWLHFDKLLYIEEGVLKSLKVDPNVVRDRKQRDLNINRHI